MRKTMLVLMNEFVTTVSRPSFIFTLFGLPIIAAVIFSVIGVLNKDKPGQVESFFSPAVDVVPVGFIDRSGLITQPDLNPQLVAYQDEQRIKQDLAQGKISGYYVVPANYLDSGELTFVKEDFNPLTAF